MGAVIEGGELVVHAGFEHADTESSLKDEDEGSGSIGTAPAVAVNGLIWGSVLEDLDGSLEVSGADVVPEVSEGAIGCHCNECQYMKMNTLLKIYNTLKYEWPQIEVDPTIAKDAVKPIERMLELS